MDGIGEVVVVWSVGCEVIEIDIDGEEDLVIGILLDLVISEFFVMLFSEVIFDILVGVFKR